MDTLRGVLMIAGVFYHAALVYGPHTEWRVRDPGPYAIFDLLSAALSMVRMPTFFIIAGFFCAMLYRRAAAGTGLNSHQAWRVFRQRATALGLPILTLVLTLQLLQFLLKLADNGQLAGMPVADIAVQYIRSGAFISHLWFLFNLLIYYFVASALLAWPQMQRWLHKLPDSRACATLLRSKTLLVLLSTFSVLVAHRLLGSLAIGQEYDADDVLRYAPFFIVGTLCHADKKLLEDFLSFNWLDGAVLLAVFAAMLMLRNTPAAPGPALTVFNLYAFLITGFIPGIALLRLCRRHFNQRSALQQQLVDASFSIYLFHHICVIALAMALRSWAPGVDSLLKYTLVVSLSCALPFAWHALVLRRVAWLRLLCNGRTTSTSA